MQFVAVSASMSFSEASTAFLGWRKPISKKRRIRYVGDRTFEGYVSQASMASQYFGPMRLDQIKPYHIRAYQELRATGGGFKPNGQGFTRRIGGTRKGWVEVPTCAGAGLSNSELEFVRRLMVDAGVWTAEHDKHFIPLEERTPDIPKALSEEEEFRFLQVAASKEKWHVVWWYALLDLDIWFDSGEMRTLRQGDLNLACEIVSVNPAFGKNAYRRRTVPILGADAKWACEQLLERSIRLVGRSPLHYLLPFCSSRGHYDGMRPMTHTGLRPAFEEVRGVAEVEFFHWNGFRHTGPTRAAEYGKSFPMIMERLGHCSVRMSRHYMHISEQAQRRMLGGGRTGLPGKIPPQSMTPMTRDAMRDGARPGWYRPGGFYGAA